MFGRMEQLLDFLFREMKVLCVGKVCLDVINYVDGYPVEDSDHSIPYQRWAQGGNASNNCVVFNQLKSAFEDKATDFEFELFGTLGTDLASNFIRDLLKNGNNVQVERCPRRAASGESKGLLSTSCVLVNRLNGTRTIVHARNDVSDVNFDDFAKADLDLDGYDWINFENRESEETLKMVEYVLNRRRGSKPIVSVEVEKNKEGCQALLTSPVDYLFISKDLALSLKLANMEEAVTGVSSMVDSGKTTIVCPWGDQGACVLPRGHDRPYLCPAYPIDQAVDTLGAGDTFFASFIFAKGQLGNSEKEALELACLVAGLKCSVIGYDRLGELVKAVMAEGALCGRK